MKPVIAAPGPREPKTPTKRLFTMCDITWLDETGAQRLARRFVDVDFAIDLAERALKCGACVPVEDARRRKLFNSWPGQPDPRACLDLDAIGEDQPPQLDSSPQSAQFEQLDRGSSVAFKLREPAPWL